MKENLQNNYKKILLKMGVTFLEAAIAFVVVSGLDVTHLNRAAVAGIIGAGLSAVYNVVIKPSIDQAMNK